MWRRWKTEIWQVPVQTDARKPARRNRHGPPLSFGAAALRSSQTDRRPGSARTLREEPSVAVSRKSRELGWKEESVQESNCEPIKCNTTCRVKRTATGTAAGCSRYRPCGPDLAKFDSTSEIAQSMRSTHDRELLHFLLRYHERKKRHVLEAASSSCQPLQIVSMFTFGLNGTSEARLCR